MEGELLGQYMAETLWNSESSRISLLKRALKSKQNSIDKTLSTQSSRQGYSIYDVGGGDEGGERGRRGENVGAMTPLITELGKLQNARILQFALSIAHT